MTSSHAGYYRRSVANEREFYDDDDDDDDNDDDDDYDESEGEDDVDDIDPKTGLPRSMVMSANLMKALGLDISEVDTSTDWY